MKPIIYFGYGSNINLISLKSKGVDPLSSEVGTLKGWQLKFNVQHWFRHEGGMGNVEPSEDPGQHVEGMVHFISSEHLQALDAVESYGVGYDRVEVEVETESGTYTALTYVGLPAFIDNTCLPTRRYLNIIINGAKKAGLSSSYVERLEKHEILPLPNYPEFEVPSGIYRSFEESYLAGHKEFTALAGHVFDMRNCREKLRAVHPIFGGRDMTVFHIRRHDSSSGNETVSDYLNDNITDGQKNYINAYLHEYLREFEYAGTFRYA